MSSENFAVHIHQSLHTDSDSWWINLAEAMFCDKRQSLSWSLILHSCKSSGSKSSLLGNWKPSDVSFLGNNVTASGARESYYLYYACLRWLCIAQKNLSIGFRSLFIYQEEAIRAKRWMEWRLYQSQTNPRHAWQGEGLQWCCHHVMFYGCIVWLAGFPRGSVHGVGGIYQIC